MGGGWSTNTYSISSGKAVHDTNNAWTNAWRELGEGCEDHYVQAKVWNTLAAVSARGDGSLNQGANHYFFHVASATDETLLCKRVNSVDTKLGEASGRPGDGGTIRIECVGNSIKGIVGGNSVSVTDSALPSGLHVGMYAYRNTNQFDDFEAGEIT